MLEIIDLFPDFSSSLMFDLFFRSCFFRTYSRNIYPKTSGAVALADALRQNSTLEHLAASVVTDQRIAASNGEFGSKDGAKVKS